MTLRHPSTQGLLALLLNCLLMLPRSGLAEVVQLQAVKDNTLYQDAQGSISNGKGSHLFAGRTNESLDVSTRRAVLAFDPNSVIPSGSQIIQVTLTLRMSKTVAQQQIIRLHKLLVDWGEGASMSLGNEGMGDDAQSGDATWIHRFFDPNTPTLWTAEGGDFVGSASASRTVNNPGSYTWGPNEQLRADVQDWLDQPSTNFGWIVLGNENVPRTAKRFNSREHPDEETRPVLTIDYDLAGAPTRTVTPTVTPTSTPTETPLPPEMSSGSPGRSSWGILLVLLVASRLVLAGTRSRVPSQQA